MNSQDNVYSISEIEAFCNRFYQEEVPMPDGSTVLRNRKLLITPHAIPTTFLNVAPGVAQNAIVTMAANADFILLGFHHRATLASAQTAASKVCPFVRMLLTDSGTNEQFTSSAVDLEAYSSNANVVNALPYPRVLSGRTTVTMTVTSFAPIAETYAVLDIIMEGVLVRAYG